MFRTFKKLTKSKHLRSAGVYTTANVINKAIPFFLLPILTRYLTPEDYGIVSMFGVLVSLVTPFIGVNLHTAIERMYFDQERVDIREYITNCIIILIGSTTIVSVIFHLFSKPIADLTSLPAKFLWVVIVVSFGQVVSQIVLKLWQLEIKPLQYGIFQISKTFLNASLSIWLVVSIGMAWQGRIWAQFITISIYFFIGSFILIKNGWLKLKYIPNFIKHGLMFGIPLVPHAISQVIMTMIDRVFITYMVGVGATGIYSVGYQIGMAISILTQSVSVAYTPWLFEKLKSNVYEMKIKIVKLTYIYFVSLFVIALVFSFVAPSLMSILLGKEFSQSSYYVIWIALGYAFEGMYIMVIKFIYFAQKTRYIAGVTLCAAAINIMLNYLLININGAIGAAQATTLTYLLKFIFIWLLSAKVYNMPWKLRNVRK